ncbi:aromatic compound dioxygenase [Desarmillaria tabescens]|uniref:Aromatic compound dioxygenase n=1 Tax=Armillaria tabescens TaxID=1929756 RepID=A0AA39N6J5_ARMTA|nr:aromatic compound dioxygenase [Desarmillaria tabescens]KAK0459155.1 aromatic compound dioxygenase [Desarmillaria tabescens]
MVYLFSIASFALLATIAVVGHPGAAPMSGAEVARRSQLQQATRRSLGACQDTLARRNKMEKSAARRAALADELRKKRGLPTRSQYKRALTLEEVLNTDHHSNATGLTVDSDPFSADASCVLTPELEQGPFYVKGEYVRRTVSEDQPGLYSYVDLELIDVSTCEPLTGVYIDFWHCNSTGVYAGVIESGNGDSSDFSNLDATFLRGIQPTNDEGYASFETVFPGTHYSGRATHFHTVVHSDGTLFDNGTFTASSEHHIGQIFFDQSLITAVELTSPYSNNTVAVTTNSVDRVFALGVEPDDGSTGVDPVLEYVYLGDDVSDGLLLWGTIGVDMSASFTISPAATLTEDGGVLNEGSSGGGPGEEFPGAGDGNTF